MDDLSNDRLSVPQKPESGPVGPDIPITSRADYNARYGTELVDHTDALSPEQATRINAAYDIRIYAGPHGTSLGNLLHDPSALDRLLQQDSAEAEEGIDALLDAPTELEYEQAAAVVAAMEPTDTLFIEGYGFSKEPPPPPPAPIKNTDTYIQDLMLAWLDGGRQTLEARRRDKQIDVWEYAAGLAALKGIPTFFADRDAFDKESLLTRTSAPELKGMLQSANAEDRVLAEQEHASRAPAARNKVKDYALGRLPPEGLTSIPERKPQLVILFGTAHEEDLETSFRELGLNITVTTMETSTQDSRVREVMARAFGAAAIAATTLTAPGIITSFPVLTRRTTEIRGADRRARIRAKVGGERGTGPFGSSSLGRRFSRPKDGTGPTIG